MTTSCSVYSTWLSSLKAASRITTIIRRILLLKLALQVSKVVSYCIACNLTTKPMSTFWVGDQIKAKLSYASDVTCQTQGHSKCAKFCDIDTTSRQGKLLIFKPKALSFCTADFPNIKIFPHRS